MRVHANTRTILQALAQASLLQSQQMPQQLQHAERPAAGRGRAKQQAQAAKADKQAVAAACERLQQSFFAHPDMHTLTEALLRGGLEAVEAACVPTPGTPLMPMLANPGSSMEEVRRKLTEVGCSDADGTTAGTLLEFKYDGQRAQVHVMQGGEQVRIFSRNCEDVTDRWPDVVTSILRSLRSSAEAHQMLFTPTVILDGEIVAVHRRKPASSADAAQGFDILPFQQLSTRKRKGVDEQVVEVDVCLFIFDVMYSSQSNIKSSHLLRVPLQQRRQILAGLVSEQPGYVELASSMTMGTVAPAQAEGNGSNQVDQREGAAGEGEELSGMHKFLARALECRTEGLVAKQLASLYEPCGRSNNWWVNAQNA